MPYDINSDQASSNKATTNKQKVITLFSKEGIIGIQGEAYTLDEFIGAVEAQTNNNNKLDKILYEFKKLQNSRYLEIIFAIEKPFYEITKIKHLDDNELLDYTAEEVRIFYQEIVEHILNNDNSLYRLEKLFGIGEKEKNKIPSKIINNPSLYLSILESTITLLFQFRKLGLIFYSAEVASKNETKMSLLTFFLLTSEVQLKKARQVKGLEAIAEVLNFINIALYQIIEKNTKDANSTSQEQSSLN